MFRNPSKRRYIIDKRKRRNTEGQTDEGSSQDPHAAPYVVHLAAEGTGTAVPLSHVSLARRFYPLRFGLASSSAHSIHPVFSRDGDGFIPKSFEAAAGDFTHEFWKLLYSHCDNGGYSDGDSWL